MFDLIYYKTLLDIVFVYMAPCNVRLAKKGEKKGAVSSDQVLSRDFGEDYYHDCLREYVLYFYPKKTERRYYY